MRSITPIISEVLLVIIVIASISIFVAWYIFTQKSSQEGASVQVSTITRSSQISVRITDISFTRGENVYGNISVEFYIYGSRSIRVNLTNGNDAVKENCSNWYSYTDKAIKPFEVVTLTICGISGQVNRLEFRDIDSGNVIIFVYNYIPS